MKRRQLQVLLLLLVTSTAFAQSKRVADRYFKNFAYPKASQMYEAIHRKGDSSKYIVKRIAESYYNNAETKKSEYWYNKLITQYNDSISNEDLFKYAQSIRSNGNYKKSDSILATLEKESIETVTKKTNYLLDYENNKNSRISVRNLAINTPFSDFGGFMYGKEVYFASASPKSSKKEKLYRWNNQPFLNIYKSFSTVEALENMEVEEEKDSILTLENKRILSAPVNTRYHESNPVITKDGKTMYFTRVNSIDGRKTRKDKKKTVNLKLYRATLVDNKWTNIVELPFNSDQYSVGHPTLSTDEKTLYFISDMPGGFGKTDLYKVAINSENYGEPVNLGATINTAGKEMFPYIGNDNTLYFSSDGHIGLGLLDIFQSRINEDSTFSKPKNLEHPFNGKRDDFAFFIDETGRKGFFSSNRKKGKGDDDIYSFIIYQNEEPEPAPCMQSITGIVKDSKQGVIIPEATVKLVNAKGEVIKEVLSDKNGVYEFKEISCDKQFTVRGSKLNYKPDSGSAITTLVSGESIKRDLALTPMIIGNQIVINPIYFDFDKSNIREDAQYELEDVVTVMNNNPNMVIKIESHTDCRGKASYNRSLSDRRAKSTRDYIFSRGIDRSRIVSAIGYGEDKPLYNCNKRCNSCTEEQHQANRRSYFIIVKGGDNVKVDNKMPTTIDRKPGK